MHTEEAQKVLEESMAMSVDDRQELALEMYRSRHIGGPALVNPSMGGGAGGHSLGGGTLMSSGGVPITIGRRTLGRSKQHSSQQAAAAAAALGKTPPRPSPASVAYHSDEESLKCYDENPDDSSVTEKPSEVSSSDSQVSICAGRSHALPTLTSNTALSVQNSESENESVRSDPHSFVNHYANVNDSLRQSWKRQKPVRNYSSYTDSEPEGSAVMSLNGGQIIVNNMARSRAPLPGFSSFV